MSIQVWGAAIQGIDALPIRVEVELLRRLPRVSIVGLPSNAVQESAERIRCAIGSTGTEFPRQRVVINLAPADVRKDGSAFDLPIACGILAADGAIPVDRLGGMLLVGELSLSGELRCVRGSLSLATLARERGWQLILPEVSAAQAALVPGADVRGARTLADVVAHIRGDIELPVAVPNLAERHAGAVDLADVRGQRIARHAIEIAAAGHHNVLLIGPPGCGKSMLARRLPTILPPLSFEEGLETTRIHSAAGLLNGDARLMLDRPFRAPHHTVSVAGLIGCRNLKPGEASLAHHGVLFLDEAAEFPRSSLEVLRTPVEEGVVRLARAQGTIEWPARLALVLATNPCPCGQYGANRGCACGAIEVQRYQRRLSGPLLDRIDLHIPMEPVPPWELVATAPGESSASVRERVVAARAFALRRGQAVPNSALDAGAAERAADPTDEARLALLGGIEEHGLSARAAARMLRVARTIADLNAHPRVDETHIKGALGFCPRHAE